MVVLILMISSTACSFVSGFELYIDTKVDDFHMVDSILIEGRTEGSNGTWREQWDSDFLRGEVNGLDVTESSLVLQPVLERRILKYGSPILEGGSGTDWDLNILSSEVLKIGNTYYLYYTGSRGTDLGIARHIGLATSTDGENFTKHPDNPILRCGDTFDRVCVMAPEVMVDGTVWRMWYAANKATHDVNICYATSQDGVRWSKYANNPVINNSGSGWNGRDLRPAGVVKIGESYRMYYKAAGPDQVAHTGATDSSDCIHWTDDPNNPLYEGSSNEWNKDYFFPTDLQRDYGTYRLWARGDRDEQSAGWAVSTDGLQWFAPTDPFIAPETGTVYGSGVLYPSITADGSEWYLAALCRNDRGARSIAGFRVYLSGNHGTYTSSIHDAGGVVELRDITWDATVLSGSSMELWFRWSNDSSVMHEWKRVLDGDDVNNITGQYFQYRVVLDSRTDLAYATFESMVLFYHIPVVKVEASIDGGPWLPTMGPPSNWQALLQVGDGDHNITVRATNAQGHRLFRTVHIRVDLLPPVGGIVLEEGRRYTSSTSIEFDIWADDSHGVPFYQLSTRPDMADSEWLGFTGSKQGVIEYHGLDGPVAVFTRFRDTPGRVSQVYSDDIIVDTTPPEGTLVIDHGAKYTRDTEVHLSITFHDMTGVVGMKVSNDPTFTGVDWSDPDTGMDWALVDEEGVQRVYVRLIDAVGWETDLMDEIILDRTPPIATLAIDNDAPYATSRRVSLNITLWGGEPVRIKLCNLGDPWSSEWERLSDTTVLPWYLGAGPDGDREVLMKVQDLAGNELVVSDDIVLDTTPPDGELEFEEGGYYTNSEFVKMLLDAYDATSGLDRMRVSNSPDLGDAPWQKVVMTFEWVLRTGEGPRTVYIELRDRAGLTKVLSSSIVLDSVPPSGLVIIDGGARYAPEPRVDVELEIFDDTSGITDMMVSNNGQFTGASWEPFRTSFVWDLSGDDGDKVLYVRVRDGSGLVGNLFGTITLDTTPPALSMLINDGNDFTTTTQIKAMLSVEPDLSGVREMAVSLSGDFSGIEWTAFRDVIDLELAPDEGEHSVHVRVRDGAGHVSTVSGKITMDTSPPAGSALINGGAELTNRTSVIIGLTATDSVSGLAGMRVSEDPGFWGIDRVAITETVPFVLTADNGRKTVYIQLEDRAGHLATISASIILDTSPPVVEIVSPEEKRLSDGAVTVVYTAEDAIDGDPECWFRVDGGEWQDLGDNRFGLVLNGGRHTIEVRATDAAGNSALDTMELVVDMPLSLSTGRYLLIVLVVVLVLVVVTLHLYRRKRQQDGPSHP